MKIHIFKFSGNMSTQMYSISRLPSCLETIISLTYQRSSIHMQASVSWHWICNISGRKEVYLCFVFNFQVFATLYSTLFFFFQSFFFYIRCKDFCLLYYFYSWKTWNCLTMIIQNCHIDTCLGLFDLTRVGNICSEGHKRLIKSFRLALPRQPQVELEIQ